MTPNEASRELARAAAIVRSTGRRIALWRAALAGLPLLALLVAASRLPPGSLAQPGSFLPMLLASLGLVTFGAAGLVAGLSIQASRLGRRLPEIEEAQGLARGELLGAIELGGQEARPTGLANLHRARVAEVLRGLSGRDLLPRSNERLRATRRIAIPGLGMVLAVLAGGLVESPGC